MDNFKDLTQGTPIKIIFLFALPLMLGNVFQQFYILTDTIIVSQTVGVTALAAIGCTEWLNWMGFSLVQGFAQGFSIPLAQAFGAKDMEKCRECVFTMAINALLSSLFFVAILLPSLKYILILLQTPQQLLDLGYSYSSIIMLGLPITMFSNITSCALRALGNSKSPFISIVIASLSNIVLDLLFVRVFNWGIQGAAIATLLAQLFCSIYNLCVLLTFKEVLPTKTYFNKTSYLHMYRLAIPTGGMNMVIAIGGMILTSVVNRYGTAFIAGFTAINKLYGILEISAVSYGYAMVSYVGQNYGAKLYHRIYKGVKHALFLSLLSAFVIMVFLVLFGKNLINLFINTNEVEYELIMYYSLQFLKWATIFLPILYVLHMYRSSLQGLSDTLTPMISGFIELFCRVGCAFLLPVFMQEKGLYFVEPAAWTGAILILIPNYYFHERKIRKEETTKKTMSTL
ncbi:MAG: MATE family efflux transporter [Erysipelotrichaceae bacterium]|nr:MATE family efflux transporter [Erysipelotrichaceae bacterium]